MSKDDENKIDCLCPFQSVKGAQVNCSGSVCVLFGEYDGFEGCAYELIPEQIKDIHKKLDALNQSIKNVESAVNGLS